MVVRKTRTEKLTREELEELAQNPADVLLLHDDQVRELAKLALQASVETEGASVYRERAMLAALLARTVLAHGGKAGIRGHEPDPDPTWSPEYWTVLLIDLPTGQVSWHLHDSDRDLVAGLPTYDGHWDGHSTELKLERVTACAVAGMPPELDTEAMAQTLALLRVKFSKSRLFYLRNAVAKILHDSKREHGASVGAVMVQMSAEEAIADLDELAKRMDGWR